MIDAIARHAGKSGRRLCPSGKHSLRLPVVSLLILISLAFSCSLPILLPWTTTTTTTIGVAERHPGHGSMLLRESSFLYILGGFDEDGAISDSGLVSSLDRLGAMGSWTETAPLPEGIARGASVSAGNLVYVLGGESDSGLSDRIYYTSISPDGKLGYGSDRHWVRNLRDLPEGRAEAACVLRDGWIYLIGGRLASGPANSIVRARIYQDGQVGNWYTCRLSLPAPCRAASAAVGGDRLYVAGGADELGETGRFTSFAFGTYGALVDARIESPLPVPLQNAVLVADGERILLAGGYRGDAGSDGVYRYDAGFWSIAPQKAAACGPSCGRAAGSLFYLPQSPARPLGATSLGGLDLAPEAPTAVPGSGMVLNNSPILVSSGPGMTVRYRMDDCAPSIADAEYPLAPLKVSAKVSASTTLGISLAAFDSGGRASISTIRNYRIRSSGFFVMIADTLALHDFGHSGYDPCVLQEQGFPAPNPVSALWYRMRIETKGGYRLGWVDACDEPGRYSARLLVSVYESDFCTEVPDLLDAAALDRENGVSAPLEMYLQPGDYYVQVSDRDSLTGRNFGIALSRN